jgi:hypothetical protein
MTVENQHSCAPSRSEFLQVAKEILKTSWMTKTGTFALRLSFSSEVQSQIFAHVVASGPCPVWPVVSG